MGSAFVNNLNLIFSFTVGENETVAEQCEESIDHYIYYQLSLIPALLITLSFAVTKSRRNILLNLFRGRPGLIFPMDTLTRSSRISYACSFGATAFLVYKIVIDQTFAIEYNGERYLKSFIAIASMFIYGMVFFPVFASLTVGSVYGYTLGALYVWTLTAVEIVRLSDCEASRKTRILLVMNGLPSLLCLFYLSLSIPVRMYRAFRAGKYFVWQESDEQPNTLEDIRDSYAGHHVTKLFKKPVVKLPASTKKGRVINLLSSLVHRFLYQRKRGFRYPARIICVMFISILVIYTMTFQFMSVLPPLMDLYLDGIVYYVENTIGVDPAINETQEITDLRELLWVIYWCVEVTKVCVIVANVLATLFSLVNVLHTLSSYRANLFALYRGDHSTMPPVTAYSNTSHCVNSIKYAGFQVGYTIWSYLIQFGILSLLAFIVALVVTLITYDFTDFFEWLFHTLWPIVLTAVLVALGQMALAKFVFLQEKGEFLALDNRNLYFNFTYFMFFYNIFLGLASCLLRIIKAMFVGIVFLSRLDSSTLPRRFEFMDPGFNAYVGFMHMEEAHSHPVVIVFCRLMLRCLEDKKERQKQQLQSQQQEKADKDNSAGDDRYSQDNVELKLVNNRVSHSNAVLETSAKDDDKNVILDAHRRRRAAARFNWHVVYTLLHNPDIRVMRKGYVNMLRQARLLGIHVPVSDRQVDVDFDSLQDKIRDAKEKLNPCKKSDDDDDDNNDKKVDGDKGGDLTEVLSDKAWSGSAFPSPPPATSAMSDLTAVRM